MLEDGYAQRYIHPDDAEIYVEDIKAVKRLLAYLGE
jgi:hypothetical protein